MEEIPSEVVNLGDELREEQLRLASLIVTQRMYGPRAILLEQGFLDVAETVYQWVSKRDPASIKIVAVGDVTKQQEDKPMQLHDDEQFTVTLEVDDAKGFALTGTQVSATSADETVATVSGDGVTYTVVAGNPGSTVITFNAGNDDAGNPVQVTEAVDVVPGDVATLKLTEGTVTKQGAAGGTDTTTPTNL